MAKKAALKRRAFYVDERTLQRAKRALGLKMDAEVVREAIDRVAEMEEFWEFMKKTRGIIEPGSLETPQVALGDPRHEHPDPKHGSARKAWKRWGRRTFADDGARASLTRRRPLTPS